MLSWDHHTERPKVRSRPWLPTWAVNRPSCGPSSLPGFISVSGCALNTFDQFLCISLNDQSGKPAILVPALHVPDFINESAFIQHVISMC